MQSYISTRGKVWFAEAGWKLKAGLPHHEMIEGPIGLTIDLYTARNQDLDNILKCGQDLLQKQGVIKNDSQIVDLKLHKYKVAHVAEERLELELTIL